METEIEELEEKIRNHTITNLEIELYLMLIEQVNLPKDED
jgi:hypothetical protein